MSQGQKVIPIAGADGGNSGGCASASSCSSGSSCSSSGCGGGGDDRSSQLQAEGWILRTTIGEPRLSEVVENYRAMGYEVQVEYFEVPDKGEEGGEEGCTTCFDEADRGDARQAWGAVYVRRASEARPLDEDLF